MSRPKVSTNIVYIVLEHAHYDGSEAIAAFSEKPKADRYAYDKEKQNRSAFRSYYVVELEVDHEVR